MMQDRLGIDAAGRVDRTHVGEQRAEFVQRAEMRWRPALEDADEGLLCGLAAVECAKQGRALDLEWDGIVFSSTFASSASSSASLVCCARRGAHSPAAVAVCRPPAVLLFVLSSAASRFADFRLHQERLIRLLSLLPRCRLKDITGEDLSDRIGVAGGKFSSRSLFTIFLGGMVNLPILNCE